MAHEKAILMAIEFAIERELEISSIARIIELSNSDKRCKVCSAYLKKS